MPLKGFFGWDRDQAGSFYPKMALQYCSGSLVRMKTQHLACIKDLSK
jgi:hypothetical protein